MHPDHQHCRCGPDRGDIGHGGNPRGGHDQPDRARCYASLDQHPRLCRWGCPRSHLGRLPLRSAR
jgi:hypothetical protein